MLLGLASTSARGQGQRIPRQSATTAAVLEGIVRTDAGLGLGGVAVVLQNLSNGRSLQTSTTGDGVFRFLNLAPGRYQVKATRDDFEPFARGEIELVAGAVFPLEFTMKAVPAGREGVRVVPRQPELGPTPPASRRTWRIG